MDGMGRRRKIMYYLIDEAETKPYRSACARILTETRDILAEKGITTQFVLVGSGGRNLVTRNGDGPYDLDYNLEVLSADDEYWHDLHKLKETARNALNKSVGSEDFSDAQDSTSVLTSIRYFTNRPQVKFKVDVAITTRNENGTLMRLIHNKNMIYFGNVGQYTWNEVPNSHNVLAKSKRIKSSGADKWLEVRQKYVDLKNMYLQRRDYNHPSFIVYVEAVNTIYNKYFH